MVQKPRSNRWTGWLKRKPSLLRPFPSPLRMEELEVREVPATYTWTGLGANGDWNNPANWSAPPSPASPVPTGMAVFSEDLVFPEVTTNRVTNNNIIGGTFNSISFSTTTTGQGYTLGGNALTLGQFGFPGTGFINVNSSSTGNAITLNMTLGAGTSVQSFTVGGELTVSGKIDGISTSSLLKSGTGTLTLSGDNSAYLGAIAISANSGNLVAAHPSALGDTVRTTTVGEGSSLQLSNVGGAIGETVLLNGLGAGNRGALFNLAGNNIWSGPITLGTGSKTEGVAIGAEDGTRLTINGIVSDTGAGQILSKEGKGEVVLNAANTYRGLTYVNSGILSIGNANALGAGGTPESGTIVTSEQKVAANGDMGQLRLQSVTGTGFTVFNEHLTLNGRGQAGGGSLTNLVGDNTWAGPVTLGSPEPNGVEVTIGTGAGTLTISGVIATPNGIGNNGGANPPNSNGSTFLQKIDIGTLIFNNANTYACPTFISEGVLIIRDSRALGTNTTSVSNGATLQLEVEAGAGPNGTALPNFDAHGRNLSLDSVTGDAHRLEVSNVLNLNGLGVIGANGTRVGALYSASGINVWTNTINSNAAGIGVALDPRAGHPTPDSSYFINDYSLTTTGINGAIRGSSVTKLQPGHLILPVANTYSGRTFIQSGWVTIQDNRSLGARIGGLSQTLQPETFVYDGAALHLRTLTPTSDPLFIDENLILSGVGPKLPYRFISEKGALMNIGGDNIVGVDSLLNPIWFTSIALNGNVGIGVEQIAPLAPGSGEDPSRLTIVGWIQDDTITKGDVVRAAVANYPTPGPAPTVTVSGGITKLGSKHLQLEGEGTYRLANTVAEGTLAARHNSALGLSTSGTYNATSGSIPEVYTDTTTTVQSGANLHLNTSNALTNGGISSGIQVAHEQLVLNNPGQQVSVAGALRPAPDAFSLTLRNHLTDTLPDVNATPYSQRTTPNFAAGVTAAVIEAELNKLTSVRSSEIQSVQTGAIGTFTLTFTGPGTGTATTVAIPAGASAGAVQTELLNLTSIRRHEIQTIDVTGGTPANSFTLSFNGVPTAPIAVGSTNLVVQAALNAIPAIGPTGTVVTATTIPGGTRYTVTFSGPLVGFTNQPSLVATGIGIGNPIVITSQNGFAGTVNVTRSLVAPNDFLYTIEYGGELSFQNLNQIVAAGTAIGPGAAQTIRDGVNGFVRVSESTTGTPLTLASPVGSVGPGNRYTIEYFGDLANADQPQMTVSMPPAATGTLPVVTTNQDGGVGVNERQDVSVVGSSTRLASGEFTGSFTLTYKTQTTRLLPITASAQLIENELNSLTDLTTDVGSVVVTKAGNVFTVVFGVTQSMDTPELIATAIDSPLGTPEIKISGSTPVDGYVSQASLVSLANDNSWRGPVVMNTGGRIATTENTRINFLGTISDPVSSQFGSELVKRGQGEMLLGGLNTYRGMTRIDAGIATVANSGALGTSANGTIVKNNAQFQVQGSLTVSGEELTIEGTGVADPSTLKDKWFNVGASSTNGVLTSGNQTQSARITSVATDPRDPNVIYIATSGGGAWKSKDRGVTWIPLFDDTVDAAAVMYGGHIAVAPNNPNVVYFATGEANGGPNGSPVNSQRDTFAGSGVYISVNAGMTWRLITGPNSNNPLYGLAISKIIVDPTNAQRIYVASGDATIIGGSTGLIANNLYGIAIPGVYRFDGSVANADWLNLTGNPSIARQGLGASAPWDALSPNNAGPNDDFRIMFPQSNATWSDIALVQTGPGFGLNNGNRDAAGNTWVLYAALGESEQRFSAGNTQGIFNAVYRTEDPAAVFPADTGPTWWIGRGTIFPVSAVTGAESPNVDAVPAPTDPDLRERDFYYEIGEAEGNNPVEAAEANHPAGRNEWIKISAVVTRYHNENPTDLTNLLFSGQRMNASVQVYTVNLRANEFLDMQRSSWDGGLQGWDAHINQDAAGFSETPFGTTDPASNATGRYSSVLISPSNTFGQRDRTALVNDRLYLGGKTDIWLVEGIRGNDTPTWTPYTQGAANRPEDYVHALYIDRTTSNMLVGTDGGLWHDSVPGWGAHSFQNMNGNITATQFNNIDPHPTDINKALAAAYNSGLQQFSGSLAWNGFTNYTGTTFTDDRLRNAGDVRYDPKNPLNAWASVGGRLYRTQNGGATWTFVATGSGNNSFPVYIDPINPERVIYGGSGLRETVTANDAAVAGTFVSRYGGAVTAFAPATYQGVFEEDDDFPLVTDKLRNTQDTDTIYITDGSTVRLTKNRGLTWVERDPFANYFPRSIEFLGSMAGVDQDIVTTNGTNLFTGGVANAVTVTNGGPGVNEVQTLVVTATGGTYTLTIRVNGILRTTGNLAFNASAAAIEAALNGLPGMINNGGTGQVRVTGLSSANNIITDIAVDPSDRDTAYITVRHREGEIGLPTVFRTTDSGRSWQDISGNATSVVPVNYTNNTSLAIPDDNPIGVESTITVAATPGEIVSSLAVTINVTHGDLSQVSVYLRGPNGTRVPLALNRTGANFTGTIFTDSAATAISGGTAPYTGLFRPEAPFSVFTGLDMTALGNSDWTLEVYDAGSGTLGNLTGWQLDLTTRPQNLPFTQAWTVAVDPRTDTIYVGNDKGVWRLPNASATNAYSWSRFGDSLPDVQVHDLVLNQTLNTLTAATYGRGMYQLFLTNYQPSVGGIRVISGNSTWIGNVVLTGNLTITADGTQRIQDGLAAASLDILGTISDASGGAATITKSGLGTVAFSGSNTYTGQTLVQQGVLRVQNPNALGNNTTTLTANTVVAAGAALELTSDLALEPVLVNGDGFELNGHFTGSLRSRANNNVYTGTLTLGTNTTIGVDPGTDLDTVINPGVRTASSLRIGADPRGIIMGSGRIVDGGSNLALTKELAGTLILAEDNDIGGAIKVNQGALRAEHAESLGSFGPFSGTTVLDGAQMQIARNAATLIPTVIANEPLFLSGMGIDVTGALRNVRSDSVLTGSNDNTWAGPITFTINPGFSPETNPDSRIAIRVDDSLIPGFTDTLNIDTNIQQNSALGSFGLIKVGPGRLNLMQANSFTGTTEVGVTLGNRDFQGGSLRIENANSLGVNPLSNSVQTLSVVGLSGTYQLRFNGETTAALPAGATAAQVEAALNGLVSIGQAERQQLAVSGSGTFTLTFNGQTTAPITTASGMPGILAALNALSTVSRPEVQDVLVSNANGYFTLTYQGQTTAPIPQGASNATVAGELNLLSSIVPGFVTVATSPTTVAGATVYRVTFSGTADRSLIVANTYTADTQQPGTPSTGEIQRVAIFSTSGTFNLTFNGLTTVPLPFNATALEVQTALNALPSVGGVGGSVAVSEAAFGSGRRFTIVFAGSLANRDVPQIVAAGVGGPVTAVVLIQDGLAGVVTSPVAGTVEFGGSLAARDVPQLIPGNFTGTASVGVTTTRPGAGVIVSETPGAGGKTLTVSFQRPLDLTVIPQIESVNVASGLAVNVATIQEGGAGAIVNSNSNGPGSLEIAGDPANLGTNINVVRNVELNGTGVSGAIRVSEANVAGGKEYTLTFDGALGNTDIPLVLAAGLGGATTTSADVTHGSRAGKEVQTVTVLGTAGTFTISLNGVTTAPLAFDATAAEVQAALNALTSLGGTAGALVNANGNNTYSGIVTLGTNSHIGAIPNSKLTIPVLQDPTPLTVPAPTLTKVGQGTIVFSNANPYGGSTTVRDGVLSIQHPQGIGTGRNEIQTVTTVGSVGAFALSFNGQSTIPLPFNSTATAVQNALNAISSVRRTEIQTVTLGGLNTGTFTLAFNGSAPTLPIAFGASDATITAMFEGLATVGSGNATVTRGAGNVLTITFTGALANQDLPLVEAAGQAGTSIVLRAVVQDGLNGSATVISTLIPGGLQYTVQFFGDLANTNLPEIVVESAMVFTNTTVPGSATVNETQTVRVFNTAGQNFRLTFDVQQTGLLPAGASAAAVEAALEGLSSVRRNEIQRLTVNGTSGQFSITINAPGGPRTATNIPFNVSAATLRTTLEGLSNVGTGNVQVTTVTSVPGQTVFDIQFIGALANRNIAPSSTSGSGGASTAIATTQEGLNGDLFVTSAGLTGDITYTITFLQDLGLRDVPQITGTSATTASFIDANTVADGNGSETQYVQVTGTNGTFFLTFRGQQTSALLFSATAADVERALNTLSTIGEVSGSVQVTRSGVSTGPGGAVFMVHFGSTLAGQNLEQLTAQTSGGTVVVITTGNDGPEGTVVENDATLQLNGNMVMDRERVTINGQGFMNQGALNVNGGEVTWQALNPLVEIPLFLGSDASIGTTIPTDKITFLLPITDAGAAHDLDIYGPGTVVYASDGTAFLGGTTYTTYTGTTTVHEGTLLLSQAGGNAILGPLVIGDAVGPADSAVVRETFNNQIADGVNIRINSDGLLDLNSFSDTVADVTIAGGHIDTGVGGLLTTGFIDMTDGRIDIRDNATVTATEDVTMRSTAQIVGGINSTLNANANLSLDNSTIAFGNDGTINVGGNLTMASGTNPSTIDFGNFGTLAVTGNVNAAGGHVAFQSDGLFTANDVIGNDTDFTFGTAGDMNVNSLDLTKGTVSFGLAGEFNSVGNVSLSESAMQFADGGTASIGGMLTGGAADIDFGINGTLTAGNTLLVNSTLDMLDNASATFGDLTLQGTNASFGLGTVNGKSAVVAQDIDASDSKMLFADNAVLTATSVIATRSEFDFGDTGDFSVTGNVDLEDSDIRFNDAGRLSAVDFEASLGSLIEFLLNGILSVDDFLFIGSVLTMGEAALANMASMNQTSSSASFGDGSTLTVSGPVSLAGSDLSVGFPVVSGQSSLIQTGDVTMTSVGPDESTLAVGAEDVALLGAINGTGGAVSAGDNSTMSAADVTSASTDFAFGNTVRFDAAKVTVTDAKIEFGTDGEFNTTDTLTLNDADVTLGDRNLQNPIFTTRNVVMTNGATINLGKFTQGSSLGIDITGSVITIGQNAVHSLGGDIAANSDTNGPAQILGPGTLDMGGADRTATVADGPENVDLNVTAVIDSSPTERLIKTGLGRLRFAPATGFTGPVTVLQGDVQADANIGPVGLKGANASLSGIGTVGQIDGAPTAGTRSTGVVAPGINYLGNGVGTLNSGNLLWASTTTFSVNLTHTSVGAPIPGVDNDLLAVTGTASLNNATLSGVFGPGIQLGDSFTILTATGGISGRFRELHGANVVFIEGHKFSVQYNPNSVVLTKILANIVNMNVTASLNPATQRQNVVLTATMTPEAGATTISPTNTVTFTFTNVSTLQTYTGTVNVNAGTNQAQFDTTGDVTGFPFLPGGTYSVSATYNGDPVDFNTANASLSSNLVIEIPVFDTMVASEPVISPESSTGIKDSTNFDVNVLMERGQLQSYTIEIRDASNALVRTLVNPITPFGPTAPHTVVPISANWDGRGTGNVVLPNGAYTATAFFEDTFGNTGSSNTITVVLDSLLPTATPVNASNTLISPNVVGVTTPGVTTLTSTVGDQPFTTFTNGTFSQWVLEIRNSSNVVVRTFTGTNANVNVAWNGTGPDNTTVLPDGLYTTTIRSEDQGGNTFTTSSTTLVLLTSPPTVIGTSNTPTVYGESITITAVVSVLANDAGVPSTVTSLLDGDTVEFFRDSSTSLGFGTLSLVSGQYTAEITVPTFNAGTYDQMFVRYIGTPSMVTEFLPGNSANFTHVVTPAPLTVTAANPILKQYGSPVPTIDFASGFLTLTGLVNGDLGEDVIDGAATTTATIASPVIPAGYPVTQGGVTANANYTMTFVDGRLFVTKAPLTITIDDKQRTFHAANPPFTFSAATLLLGDPASVVTGFTLTTTANVNSPPGTYPITMVGTPTAQNYDIVNVIDGTLEVIPIPTPIVIGPGAGTGPLVKVFSTTGVEQSQFFAFTPSFTGGVRTGSGDFNRDGVMDMVVATGPGQRAQVRVIDGASGNQIFSVFPFDNFDGGVFVAAGDIDGDGADELIITPDEGGGPRVVAYSGMTFNPFISFLGINDPNFRGGARAAVGDMNGDGRAEIAVSAGFNGGPRITIWDGASIAVSQFTPLSNFFAYAETLRNGTYVAIGDVDGDGRGDLITGAGPGGAPHVKVYDGAGLLTPSIGPVGATLHANFFAGDQANRGGIRVAVKNLDNDLQADLVTGVGDKGGGTAAAYLGTQLAVGDTDDSHFDINAFPGFMNGVFVG